MIYALVLKNIKYPVKGVNVPVDHYAIYNENTGVVIHNSPDNPGVQAVSEQSFLMKYFADRYDSFRDAIKDRAAICVPAPSEEVGNSIWQRAQQKIGIKYNALTYNCEHFARWCFEGTAMSTQVQKAIRSAVEITGFAYLAYKFFQWLGRK